MVGSAPMLFKMWTYQPFTQTPRLCHVHRETPPRARWASLRDSGKATTTWLGPRVEAANTGSGTGGTSPSMSVGTCMRWGRPCRGPTSTCLQVCFWTPGGCRCHQCHDARDPPSMNFLPGPALFFAWPLCEVMKVAPKTNLDVYASHFTL
jgi:hypothetical protein